MSRRLEAMRRNPQGDWTIRDVEALCAEFGIGCAAARAGGSHYKVTHASQSEILTVPFKRPIKPIYVRRLVSFVDAVRMSDARS